MLSSVAELSKTVAVIPDPQLKFLFTIPQAPLLEVSVKPALPEAVAVKPAHVPVVYQVPPLMMQPIACPPMLTWSVPLPEKGSPGTTVEVGPLPVVVVELVPVVVGGEGADPDFGRYLTPDAGQSDLDPSGLVGMKVPVWMLPATSKKYQISSNSFVFAH